MLIIIYVSTVYQTLCIGLLVAHTMCLFNTVVVNEYMRYRFKKDFLMRDKEEEGESSDYAKELERLATWTKLHKNGFVLVKVYGTMVTFFALRILET